MIKHKIKLIIILWVLLSLVLAGLRLHHKLPPSLADHLGSSPFAKAVDEHWLPDLTGLPNPEQVALLTQQISSFIKIDQDPTCSAIDLNLRMMIFQHFAIYQYLVNAQNIYFDDAIAHQWAHILAMVLKESSVDSSSITSMSGQSLSTYSTETNLQHWREILTLSKQSQIQMNFQTNFGLTQLSSDRLFAAFRLAQEDTPETAFLEGREGLATPGKQVLNTAIAVRRLIWFYQDFAQGRIAEIAQRIHRKDMNSPDFSARYQAGLERALLYCGTAFMFGDPNEQTDKAKMRLLKNAMASIAYCKLGNARGGYGKNQIDETCFAQWVTLCPALNIDIATLTPLSYFATRGQTPVCETMFRRLLHKKTGHLRAGLFKVT